MEPGHPDVAQQIPAGGGQNKPASGTYGETAALDRLKSQLPGEAADQPQAVPPPPMPSGPGVTPPSPGLPKMLTAPVQGGIPATTPLTVDQEPTVGATPELVRVAQALLRAPTTSPTTREWARILLARHAGGQPAPAAAPAAPAAAPGY
jgi:hypothetical protein